MIARLFRSLFQTDKEQSRGELWYFKIFELFIVVNVINYAWKWAQYIPRNTEVVKPAGIAHYIDITFMFGDFLPSITAGLITILCVLAFFRIQFRAQYLVVLFLLHLLFVARFSQGKIPHGSNLIGMSLLALALAILLYRTPWKISRFTFGSVYLFVGLSYLSAAISKLIGSGLFWFDGRHLWLWISEKSIDILSRTGTFELNFLQELALQSIPIASIILLLGWITEFCGVLIWSNKYRPYIVTALIGMHLGIMITMNIRFDIYIYELLLIGYAWDRLFDKYESSLPTFNRLPAFVRS